jgi:agmatine/peptidylarginine deiminase
MKSKAKIMYVITVTILLTASFGNLVSAGLIGADNSQKIVEFQLQAPPPEPIRQPAEFEPMEGVLIRYPFGISFQIIAEMSEDVEVVTIVTSQSQEDYVESQYEIYGVNTDHTSYLIAPSDSYWTRDYGPWFVFNGDDELGVIDFTYNRPRPNDNAIPSAFAYDQGIPYYFMSLEHAGGNYMTDGQGISISTDLVWIENPGYSPMQINGIVEDYLGITTYHVVPDVNGEYIKHIDCWGKYLAPDVIMIREVPQTHLQYDEIEAAVDYFESQISCYGTPYEIARVYTPNNQPYTNSLILNNKVLVPITGSQWDDEAIESYENAMPGYEVLGFTGSWQSTDALHCRAKGIPDRYMLYVEHTPLFGVQNGDDGVDIQAKIVPYSGENLISGSTSVYWKEEEGDWNSVQMTSLGDNDYHAIIYPQENRANIYYYIHVEDESGRIEKHPYIGASGAHSFIVNITEINNPPEKPSRPSGETQGNTGTSYPYSTNATDPDGDKLEYGWDWNGDDIVDQWDNNGGNYYTSGTEISTYHTWSEDGTYLVKVKTKDIHGEESIWSDPLSVTMPKNNKFLITTLNYIEFFFPRLYSILNNLLYLK